MTEVNQQPINTIILVAKKYIFENARKSGDLGLNGFLHYLDVVYTEQELLSQL